MPYRFKDQPFLFLPNSYDPVSLSAPKNIEREIVYDPISRQYIIREKIGTKLFRPPLYLTLDEYKTYEFNRLKKNYWEELAQKELDNHRKSRLFPVIEIESPAFEQIFGGNTIDLVPRGSAEVTLMGQHNTNQNPMFNETQRNQWGFDFDQNINLNLTGNIGENLKINANFNSRAQFDFENQIRFDYVAKDDAILRRLEIGNVSMPLNTTLIQGSEALFGVKAELQFGKLTFTGLISQQRSRTKEFTISNGSRDSEVKITLDNYEDNQHYFLGQYFRDNYNNALAMAPIINSNVNILQVEVWTSNRANSSTDSRDIIALLDLAEYTPYNSLITQGSSRLPSTGIPGEASTEKSNNLLDLLGEQGRLSNGNFTQSFFAATGTNDNYAKLTYARKLVEGKDYVVNKRLGYISLFYPLNQDQALSVAYKYMVNGKEYQVGEFSTDIPVTPSEPKALYTKLLKNEVIKTNLPIWNLMMKNIYSLNATNVSENNFSIQIYRTENETGTERPAIYEGVNTQEKTYLQLAKVDRLTQQQAAGADGLFDFIPDVTIDPARGKLIFPVIEPFGKDLAGQFQATEVELIEKYTFPELYSNTKVDAQQLFPNKNRYLLRGNYSSASGTEFQLGVFNLTTNGIKVMSGGMVLEPNVDYTVDFQLGTLRILNEALVLSGQPITVSVEDDSMYGLQQKTLLGGRFDYLVNDKLKIGATVMNLTEKPLSEKVYIGEEPISNTMLGADLSYSTTSRWLTRMVDKIPFLSTKEESHISFYGEYAQLIPGHPSGLDTDLSSTGTSYIDDFENVVSYIDIKGQSNWQISGTPRLFPESELVNDLSYGFNRSLLSFYNIDPIFYKNSSTNPNLSANELSNHRVREVSEQEIFPYKQSQTGIDGYLQTLDLAFYPTIRGPYNYATSGINSDGTLINPRTRWGGMFRKMDQTDFEAQNIEFLEMWLMDPTLTNPNKEGGDVYFNLGNISEDILKDGRKSLENGIPPSGDLSQVELTNWGYVIKNQPVVQAFDNDPVSRVLQDVGLDGLGDREESVIHSNFLNQLRGLLNPEALEELTNDPSSDNYGYFIGNDYSQSVGILDRYKKYSGLEGNSRTNEQSQADFGVETSARTLLPDGEDVNRDNTMNEVEEYYQYKMSTRPQDMAVGKNFIVEEQVAKVTLKNGNQVDAKWYKVRIPITSYESKYGNINDFKSIRFVRVFMTNYADTAILRFGRMQFVRGEWRKYNAENDATKVISDPSLGIMPSDNSTFNVANVSIEENGNRSPIPYVVPPGINRQIDLANNNLDVELNEQSLSIDVQNLRDGYGRAAYKTTSHDFRAYGNLEMFIHAEGENLRDGDFRAFFRLGTDDKYNYYEYDMPLAITPYGTTSADLIWPEQNRMNIQLSLFQDAKLARDKAQLSGQPWPLDVPFEYSDGNNRIVVVGTPDLSKIRYYLMGIKNPLRGSTSSTGLDDGRDLSGEFWFNELRLTDFDDRGGWAATARLNLKLADFANVSFTGTKSTIGFGSLSQRLAERSRSDDLFFDITTNAELGKFFHPRHGIVIPFYFNYSKQTSTPEYNPFSPDIELNTALATLSNNQQDSLFRLVQDYTMRKSFSFSNVRKIKTNNLSSLKPWSIENFSATYAYSEYIHRDFNTALSVQKTYRGALDYTYSNPNIKFYEPFKNIKNENLKIIKDINFNLMPSLINFRLDVNRIYNENTLRDNSTNNELPTYYNKNFNMNRIYGISWDLTKSLRLDFNATNYSIIDEHAGVVDGIKQDTMWSNFWKMGRTTDYNHMMNITYTFPIYKVPYLEWVNVIARYGAQFNWQSEPLLTLENPEVNLGNTIQNNRTIQLNPSFNMQSLYNKFWFIRKNSGRNAKGSTAFFTQLLTMVRTVNGAYTRIEGTYVPGYLPVTTILGYDFNANAPGWGFLFGSQGDIISKALQNNWLTTDTLQTQLFSKTYSENFSYLANLEPIKGLRIDFTGTRIDNYNITSNVSINTTTGLLENITPYTTGNYSVSQIGIQASFRNHAYLFREFESNKQLISHILAQSNLNSVGQTEDQFADGYGKEQQDVVVNAFLATYLGKDINSSAVNKTPRIPLPNWRISYNGLAKIAGLDEIFTSININHSYLSQYNISGYNSMIRYDETGGAPSERDANNNFLTKNVYQEVSILDQFVPLIGIDARLKNNVSANSEFRSTKSLNFSLQNSQLAMMTEESFVLGLGYRKNNFILPFGWFSDRKLKNDLNFRMDLAINDRKTLVYRSDIAYSEVSSGNKSISYNPTLDLTINQTYNIRLFYNSNVVKPYTSQNYATSYTYFGVNLRVMFQ
ncbi:cell surface protein SprA [Sphingobacterium hungaricum]|uniref:T9SS outer membrane translocon Sov/SprA n=1 Tax=Sphingobacterium hungaricum TaxID=2082723 RepID=UPI001E37A861|nr:cell surface protein SprA [Sphingobacterium hungaricum]